MAWFKKKKRENINEIIKKVDKKDLVKRYILLIFGIFIATFAFNLFFLQYNIVCFGISGLSIVMKEYGIDPTLFITISSIILLILSFILLGWDKTKNSIVGSLLFPLFVELTSYITPYINIDGTEIIVIALFGAVLSGIGYGLVYKTGFTTGGTDILNQIFSKYFHISIGNSMLLVDGAVVLSGKLVFSWDILLYGIIVLYIISYLSDRMILGISDSKAFYVITSKEEAVREFLTSLSSGGVTIINAKGGYTNEKKSMFLCVIPTREYFVVKESLREIDNDVFFLVTDAYEVNNRRVKS